MHEYPVTQDIIKIASKHAAEAGTDAKIKKVTLVIGESCDLVGECIRLYFDIIAEGTACEGAELVIESVKPMLKCKACGKLFERKPFSFTCECGGDGEPTEIGREFFVKSIEVSSG